MFGGRNSAPTEFESKGRLARRLLAEFAARRPEDLVALMLFSGAPIPVLSSTRKAEVIQAAITAGGIGNGLSETDIDRGLLSAAEVFVNRAYAGSRLILLVSDGGAQLEDVTKAGLGTSLRRHRIGLYWIYIRSSGSRGIEAEAETAGDAATASQAAPNSERALHVHFSGIRVPYRAYEARDPAALKRAIDDAGWLENLPIDHAEMLPGLDLATPCYALAAAGSLLLLELAKRDYRDVLGDRPQHWDARYNLELALRLPPEGGEFDDVTPPPMTSDRALPTLKGMPPGLP